MTESGDESLAEIGRGMRRVEAALLAHQAESRQRLTELANQMQTALAPIAVHGMQLENHQRSIEKLESQVQSLLWRAAFIAGGIAGIGSLIDWLKR